MITTTKKTKVKKTTNTNIKFPNLFLCCKHVQFIHYSHSHYTVPLLRCRDLFSLASVTEEYLQDIPKLYKHLHCIWVLHNSWREFRRSSQRISLPYFILTLQTWHSGLHSTFSFTFWKNPTTPPPPPRRSSTVRNLFLFPWPRLFMFSFYSSFFLPFSQFPDRCFFSNISLHLSVLLQILVHCFSLSLPPYLGLADHTGYSFILSTCILLNP